MRFFICAFLMLVLVSFTQNDHNCSLTVKVSNFRSIKGVLEIGLYRVPSSFPKVGQTYRMVRVKVESSDVTYTFTNLAADNYAVCVYHDENSNKVCDKNVIGIPTEGYGFSNNIRPRWSAPDFDECATHLVSQKTFRIQLIN